MSDVSPRQLRHFRSLFAAFFIIATVFVLVYCVFPSSFLNSAVPTAFTLSISTVSIIIAIYSFTSPSKWYPEDVRHIVHTSDPSDWEFSETDEGEKLVYKNDRSISIETAQVSGFMDYHEPWMDVFEKTEGTRYKAKILKDRHEYDYCYLVWVDGKILVPEPNKWGGETISHMGDRVARLIEMARAQGIRPSMDEQKEIYEQTIDFVGFEVED
ncbi:hypothetical protein [Haladaptatus sp. DJG-WS-42]|uniref:hypothetical protein n=1 Tax=Haladaptatus sp. DJG-WS-42 TaxID=3120516 RepID=UPI0030CC7077